MTSCSKRRKSLAWIDGYFATSWRIVLRVGISGFSSKRLTLAVPRGHCHNMDESALTTATSLAAMKTVMAS